MIRIWLFCIAVICSVLAFNDTFAQTRDLARLYETVGIRECASNYVYKTTHTRVILLMGNDELLAKAHLRAHFGDGIDAVLYTYGPESTVQRRGQPMLAALHK